MSWLWIGRTRCDLSRNLVCAVAARCRKRSSILRRRRGLDSVRACSEFLPSKRKTLPLGSGGFWEGSGMVRGLGADDVGRLEAFGALEQIKLHGFTLVQGAVAVLLDGGEVHEYIFPRGALDKSIALRPVEPLDCTFLSHGNYSFHQSRRIFSGLPDVAPVD